VLEVGAGDSSVAAILYARGYSLHGLEITDASAAMLAYPERWADYGGRLTVADARSLHRGDASVALLVASLGDAYNLPEAWKEISRVMKPGGEVLFTVRTLAGQAVGRSPFPLDLLRLALSARFLFLPSASR